jgi:hypothetical protein
MLIKGITIKGTPVNDGLVTNGLQLYLDSRNPNSWTGSGQTWYDISGNGKHATFYTNPSNGSSIQNVGGAEATATAGTNLTYNQYNDVRFKGDSTSNVYQYAAGSNLGTGITTWTINTWFWIYTNVATNTRYSYAGGNGECPTIFTGEYSGGGGLTNTVNYCLGFFNDTSGGTPSTSLYASFYDGSWHSTTTGYACTINTWYNGVATYDGTTLKLYINNQLQASRTVSSTAMPSSLGYRVARRWDGYDSFDGYVPVAMLYNRALSAAEIAQNFNYHRSRYGI